MRYLRLFSGLSLFVLLFGLVQPARALEIAPYFHAWGPGTLVEAKRDAGLTGATIAFGITNGSCMLDGDLLGRLPDARAFTASGGTVLISFGGSAGTYVEIACRDDNQLFSLLDRVITDSGIRRTDWDVEGAQLLDTAATARRTRVLKRLQAKYPDLFVSFTLPGWLLGLDANSMNLLRTTIAAGVRVDRVNVMAMSFGHDPMVPATLAQSAIMTFRAAAAQMMTLFPGKSQGQIHAMMGITPMIGRNDDGTTFTLEDAGILADFVRNNGVGMIAYWSFQRDRLQYTPNYDLGQYSGYAQTQFAFLKVFQTAKAAPTPIQPPAPPAPPTAGNCSPPAWVQGRQYLKGDLVSYQGGRYIAKFANPGWNPTISTYYWAASPCAAPAPSCSPSAWVQGKQYAAGAVVNYSGANYVAKFANPGWNPTISTYFWRRYFC